MEENKNLEENLEVEVVDCEVVEENENVDGLTKAILLLAGAGAVGLAAVAVKGGKKAYGWFKNKKDSKTTDDSEFTEEEEPEVLNGTVEDTEETK